MNKKAFVLMETIVVIVVISIALLTIFKSYNKILSKVKSENKYDTSEYIYMTKYIKDYLKKCNIPNTDIEEIASDTVIEYYNDYTNTTTCTTKLSIQAGIINFNIKKIYILKNINDGTDEKFKKFDAYMIDYLKKLDVGDKDEIIVVEYERIALDDKGNKYPNDTNPLKETYIASLEWD